jgi:NAD(P)-dependent dehydrogenase (short-subunit alcohol dehydrogenase family)
MLTIQFAYEFRDTPMNVNSANPGYTATDNDGNQGNQTVEEGAAEPVRLALLPSDGPTVTIAAECEPLEAPDSDRRCRS